jgi:hypothetical protein
VYDLEWKLLIEELELFHSVYLCTIRLDTLITWGSRGETSFQSLEYIGCVSIRKSGYAASARRGNLWDEAGQHSMQ